MGVPYERIEVVGKEILLDGQHLADAKDDATAQVIADALEYSGLPSWQWPPEACLRLMEFMS